MKKVAFVIAFLISILNISACGLPPKYSLEDIQNIMVAGLDIDGEDIILTIVVDTLKEAQTPEDQQSGTKIYRARGQTVFEAKREMSAFTEKHIKWDQLTYIIVGEEAAKQSVDKLLYFFCENEENKFTHRILLAKGLTAAEFIESANTTEMPLSELLKFLSEEEAQTGASSDVTLLDYFEERSCRCHQLMLPTILLTPSPVEGGNDNAQQPYIVKKEGYAIFIEDQLIDFLDAKSARALNIVLNDIKSTAFVVRDWHDQNTSLELIYSAAKIKPNSKTLSAEIDVDMKLNIVEYFEGEGVFDPAFLVTLEKNLNALVADEITAMVEIIQSKRSDVMLLGEAFFHQDPEKWQPLMDDWVEIFPDIPVTVKVSSTIQCSYNLQSATGK